MESRLRDLISTADRQLAAQSYDAAVDTYRTALAELSDDAAAAERAGIEGRLEVASKARENSQRATGLLGQARYQQTAGRFAEAFAAVSDALSLEPSNTSAVQLRRQLLEAMPELAIAPPLEVTEVAPVAPPALPAPPPVEAVEPPAIREPEPERLPSEPRRDPIEPPSFHLIEDDPSMLARPRRREYPDEPPLSILDPTPPPEGPDRARIVAISFALVGAFVAVIAGSHNKNHATRFSPPVAVPSLDRAYRVGNGVSEPVVRYRVEPEYTEAARQAKIEGTVVLFVEVEPSGRATVRGVLRGLDPGLDDRATEAVGRWRFQPGMKDGQPVRVLAKVEVIFRLP